MSRWVSGVYHRSNETFIRLITAAGVSSSTDTRHTRNFFFRIFKNTLLSFPFCFPCALVAVESHLVFAFFSLPFSFFTFIQYALPLLLSATTRYRPLAVFREVPERPSHTLVGATTSTACPPSPPCLPARKPRTYPPPPPPHARDRTRQALTTWKSLPA